MSLILAIKCITPLSAFKDYIIKIYHQQLNIPIDIQNQFIHNYQYVYKLWSCEPGEAHSISIQLIEKIGESNKFRGKVEGKIICSFEGDMYKMHGVKENDQLILMKFIIQNENASSQAGESQLKKINKQMQQNLQKYRKELQGYQQFLYFTNNVIKELNQEGPPTEAYGVIQQSVAKQSHPYIDIKQQEINNNDKFNQSIPSLSDSFHTQRSLKRNDQRQVILSQQQKTSSFRNNFPSPILEAQGLKQSNYSKIDSNKSNISIKRNQMKTYLNKYPYLEQEYHENKRPEIGSDQKQMATTGKNTPINMLRQDNSDEDLSNLLKIPNQISILIKKRRQKYLIPKQSNFKNSNSNQAYSFNKNSNLANKKYQNKNFQISSLQQTNLNNQLKIPETSNQPQCKSTRSQTGLKQMSTIQDKSIAKDKPSQNVKTIQFIKQSNQKQESTHNHVNKIITNQKNTVRKSSEQKQQDKRSQSLREKSSRQSASKIVRRKKMNAQKDQDVSARYTTQQIKQLDINQSVALPKQNLVGKLAIFNIHSLFYTNYKNSIKKCIIEHNHQIYQTQHQQNNLKETSWLNDRIILNSISPFEQIIFQIYSLKNQKMVLQGSSIISITQIISNKNTGFKFYLYFDDIAVGYIKFDVERQAKSYKRLSVSLPQLKEKSASLQADSKTSKTVRIKANQFYLTEAFHPLSMQLQQSMINSVGSKEQQRQLNYEDLSSKIRNLKLQRKNRLK